MNLYGYEFQRDSDLAHYGVTGMKWGSNRKAKDEYKSIKRTIK